MDDLVPFLIFILIALINLVKFLLEKGAKGRKPAAQPAEEPPPAEHSTIEEFFESLAEKMAPKPTELPDWPEGYERPDYMKEMEEFNTARPEGYEEEVAEIIPMPTPAPRPVPFVHDDAPERPAVAMMEPTAFLKSGLKSVPSLFSSSQGMRLPATTIMNSATGRIDFPLENKRDLRKAIIANIILQRPRAYDTSIENLFAR